MSAVSRVQVQVPQDLSSLVQSYKLPENKEKADGVFKQLFALDRLFSDKTSQPTSQEITQSITNLSAAVAACDSVAKPNILLKTVAKVPLLNKVISEEKKAECSVHHARGQLQALLVKANAHNAEYAKELSGMERRYVALTVKKEPISLEMLQGAIDPKSLLIEGQRPEDLEMLFTQLISQTCENANVEARVNTFKAKDEAIPEGLAGRDLAILQAASPLHFESLAKSFTTHCQGYTHKDKTPYFTPSENIEKRKTSIADGVVVQETEFALKRKTDGEVFATVKAKLEGSNAEFYGITLFNAIKPDLEKLNRVFNKQAKVEAASGASVE